MTCRCYRKQSFQSMIHPVATTICPNLCVRKYGICNWKPVSRIILLISFQISDYRSTYQFCLSIIIYSSIFVIDYTKYPIHSVSHGFTSYSVCILWGRIFLLMFRQTVFASTGNYTLLTIVLNATSYSIENGSVYALFLNSLQT